MVKTIDHYAYWNKNRSKQEPLKIRELRSLSIVQDRLKPNGMLLDAGCGNGKFLLALKKRRQDIIATGTDYSPSEVAEAKKHGLNAKTMDFGEGMTFKNETFDFVYAGEIIEHLYDPDLFLEEIHRTLKKSGYVLITTPNLCAWFNRLLMLAGIQPLFLEPSTRSKLIGSGLMGKFKRESQPVGHVRIFTLQALKDMLAMYGFAPVSIEGSPYQEGFPPKLLFMDKIISSISPSIAGQFIILARKL